MLSYHHSAHVGKVWMNITKFCHGVLTHTILDVFDHFNEERLHQAIWLQEAPFWECIGVDGLWDLVSDQPPSLLARNVPFSADISLRRK